MTNDFKLPLVGLGTCYYEFSKENPDAGVRRHRGGLRRLLEMEFAKARCEFDSLKGYYETLDMTDPLYLAGVRQCAYLGAKGALLRKDYDMAYMVASVLLNIGPMKDAFSAFPIFERLICAHACHELGRREEAYRWFRLTAELTCPYGIVLPYLLLAAWLGPVMGDAIREVSPEAASKVRRLAPAFFANLIRFHNHFTGGSVTTALTAQEFYLSQQLTGGCSYEEIARKLNVSRSRVNTLVESVYGKLKVHGKARLGEFVF